MERGADRSPAARSSSPRLRDRDVDVRLTRIADEPEDRPAAPVRRTLAEAREEGLRFARAWERALTLVPPNLGKARCDQAAQEWRIAVVASKAAFQRAYDGAARTPGDHAVRALADALP